MGNKITHKYHLPTCNWLKHIRSVNIIKYTSVQDAVAAGYIPCKDCNPPIIK